MTTKICGTCKEAKSLDMFHKHPLGKYGVRGQCKICRRAAANNANRKKGILAKEKHCKNSRDWHYKNRYGLSVDEVDKWKQDINFTCPICEKQFKAENLHIDHCHTTGQVREILCRYCNLALGCVSDDINILEKLKEYILKWKRIG